MINLKDRFKSFLLSSGIEGNKEEQKMYSLGKEVLQDLDKGKLVNGEKIKFEKKKNQFYDYMGGRYNQYYSCFLMLREKIERKEKKVYFSN